MAAIVSPDLADRQAGLCAGAGIERIFNELILFTSSDHRFLPIFNYPF
jgi:hypothetical protein